MMEGSLLFFSLLTIAWLAAVIVAEHSATDHSWVRRLPTKARYALLGMLAGLTVTAKHTGIIIAVTVIITLMITALINRRLCRALWSAAITGIAAVVVWFALNPGYWRDPVGVTRAMLAARAELLDQQRSDPVLAYHSTTERLAAVVTQPYMQPPQYYEAPTWADLIDEEIAVYETSNVDGWQWGNVIGAALTALAGLGLALVVRDALRRDLLAVAVLVWAAVTIGVSLTIPLNWQRYYLPLTLVAMVLAAMGMARLVVRRFASAA
jgi:hypothetical protein